MTLDLGAMPPNAAYGVLTATVAPRPIAFVSTLSAAGTPNLAPFSFFMVGGANPPSLMFSPVLGPNGEAKDSLRNVEETGEFVINTVHRSMAEGMNAASLTLPPHESEWDLAGFTPIPSHRVRPARVAESLIQFECRLFQIVEHGDGPTSARYVIGEVVLAHLAPELWDLERSRALGALLLARMGGAEYMDMQSREPFTLQRPKRPQA